MTKQEAVELLTRIKNYKRLTLYEWLEIEKEALNMAIEALEQIESGRYVKGECSICSKECGTLGCCTTVSNHWVYSCKEGMAQYAEALEQEPIIRCEDCKHHGTSNCPMWGDDTTEDYMWCCDGARKENDK